VRRSWVKAEIEKSCPASRLSRALNASSRANFSSNLMKSVEIMTENGDLRRIHLSGKW
jgi:hypothetical protein